MMTRQRKRRVDDVTSTSTKRRRLSKATDSSEQQSLCTDVKPADQLMHLALAKKPEVEDMIEETVCHSNGRFMKEAKRRISYTIVGKSLVHSILKEEKFTVITTPVNFREPVLIPICAREEHSGNNEETEHNAESDSYAEKSSCEDNSYTRAFFVEVRDNESDGSQDTDYKKDNSFTDSYSEKHKDGDDKNQMLPPWHTQCNRDATGECLSHKHGCDCCRYIWSWSNVNYDRSLPKVCPKEIFELRESWENKKLGKCQNLVRVVDIRTDRGPCVYLYTDEIIKMCSAHSHWFEQLRVDRTWNLGTCYVTMLVFRNHNLVQDTKGLSPLMCGPVLLHYDKEYSTYKTFFQHIHNAMGFKDSETKCLGADKRKPKKDRVIHQAMREVFGENVALTDSSLVHQRFRHALRTKVRCYSPLLDVIEEARIITLCQFFNMKATLADSSEWNLSARAREVLKIHIGEGNTRHEEGIQILLDL